MPKRKQEFKDSRDDLIFKTLRKTIKLTKKDFYLPNRVMLCKIGRLNDPLWKINLIHTSYITFGKFGILIFPAQVSRCRRSKVTGSLFSSGKLIGHYS